MFGLSVTQLIAAGIGAMLLVLLLRAVVRSEPDHIIRRLILAGFAAKLVGTAAYYRVIADVYGSGDVTGYVTVGRRLAPIIRSGTLPDEARETGTRFMEFLVGVVFAIAGPREIVGYLVFSLLSFAGMVAFVKALQLAAPAANHRRYAFLVLLVPTMVFWPSTIGKDAWLVFTLGMGSYGVARVLTRARFGYALTIVSAVAMVAVRPHMAALFSIAFAAAYLVRLADKDVKRGTVGWLVGLALVGGVVVFSAETFSEDMGRSGIEEGSTVERLRADTEEVFDRTDRNTRRGGGEFDSRPVEGPIDLLHAIVTVPFRPFPTEAHNIQAQLSSLEGLLLMALTLAALPSLVKLPRLALRKPYLAFVALYTFGFIIAFSNVANFGILTRQRSQLLPFLLVLLALEIRSNRDPGKATRKLGRRPTSPPLVSTPSATVAQHHEEEHTEENDGEEADIDLTSNVSDRPTPPQPHPDQPPLEYEIEFTLTPDGGMTSVEVVDESVQWRRAHGSTSS